MSTQRYYYRISVLVALFGSSVVFLLSQRQFLRQFHYNLSKESEASQQLMVSDKKSQRLQWGTSANETTATAAAAAAAAAKNGSPSMMSNADTDHVMHNEDHSHHHLHFNYRNNHNGTDAFCLPWNSKDAHNRTHQPFDLWWTHHPTYVISNETDDTFCVEPSTDYERNEAFQRFYDTQFDTGCDEIQWRVMWSSGWGADMMNVQSGLAVSADKLHIPLVMGTWNPWDDPHPPNEERIPWHYAANKDDHSNKTCEQADMTCYFLPYHDCGSLREIEDVYFDKMKLVENEELPEEGEIYNVNGRRANEFLTRQQLWLRRAVYDFKQQFKSQYDPETDCSVIHVRRSDVILHDEFARKYFPVTDYVHLIPAYRRKDPKQTVFLLTDDQNAIDEAHEFHPELRWKYINRTRFRGSEGGWEHQTPSNNPAKEVITLLSTFDLVKECSLLVHGSSKFSEMLWHIMSAANDKAKQRRVDSRKEVFSANHSRSEFELLKWLNAMRQGESNSSSSKELPTLAAATNATSGLIVVNVLGLLANDLFEAAFAARMKEQLGWRVVYRTMWNPAWPTAKTDKCFPNVKREAITRGVYEENNPIGDFLRQYGGGRINQDIQELYEALTYVDMEQRDDGFIVNDQPTANDVYLEWIEGLGDQAKSIKHMEYPLQEYNVDKLVEELRNPRSPVRVLDLQAFFIHFDWMREWMGPKHLPHWLEMNTNKKCCPTPSPKKNTIVIHIRDFEPEDDGKNKDLQVGVFRDIINEYYQDKKDVWVVCQPKSINSTLVQDLVKEFNAQVHTGTDNIDAFCILTRARIHIPSTSSSFSQMAALLAQSNVRKTYGNDTFVEVHYPTHTLDHPMVTLKVPGWKYHLTNSNNNGVENFDVDHSRLSVEQA